MKQSVELPYFSKYLLIASYLASYNPAKSDKKFFVKVRALDFGGINVFACSSVLVYVYIVVSI